MSKNNTPDPCPREISGSDLVAGMTVFQRVVEKGTENVKFKPDHVLQKRIDCPYLGGPTVGCRSGIHFKTNKGNVCYWTGATLWVK